VAEKSWHYNFPMAIADLRTEPSMLQPGFSQDIVGVDGRLTGGLTRFAGLRPLVRLTGIDASTTEASCDSSKFSTAYSRSKTINFFKYAEVRKGADSNVLYRGFVVRIGYTVTFQYYDPEAASWASTVIDSYSGGDIDVTYGDRFLWYINNKSAGKTLFWENDDWTLRTLGHLGNLFPFSDVQTNEGTGLTIGTRTVSFGLLDASAITTDRIHYRIGIRFVDSQRNMASPLRIYELREDTPTSDFVIQGKFRIQAEETTQYDTIEIYRTINNGSYLYREIYHHVPTAIQREGARLSDLVGDGAAHGTHSVGLNFKAFGTSGDWIYFILGVNSDFSHYEMGNLFSGEFYIRGTMDDEELVLQESYDVAVESAGSEPRGDRIYYMDGRMFLARASLLGLNTRGDVYFSPGDSVKPETFQDLSMFPIPRPSDRIECFVRAGDYLYGIANTRMFRFAVNGTSVATERIAHGWGLLNRNCVVEASGNLFVLGQNALFQVNGATGNGETIGVVERLLADSRTWADDLASLFLVYDSVSSCLYIVNPVQEEAIALWGTTRTVTRLKDMNFVAATSGPHPVDGGIDRAYFITANGLIVTPADLGSDISSDPQTQLGVTGTVNGSITGSSGITNIQDSAASFDSDLQDCYVYILSGSEAGNKYLISSNTGTALTIVNTGTLNVAAGDRYAVSPIPMEWTGWPLAGMEEAAPQPIDQFYQRIAIAMGLHVGRLTGETDSNNAQATVGLTTDPYGTLDVSDTIYLTLYPRSCYGKTPLGEPIMFPVFRCYASNLGITLRGVHVLGELTSTVED